jgi:hypothetical protein
MKREHTPYFYGYMPKRSTKRSIIFTSLTFFSMSLLLIRCTTIAVLGQLGGSWVVLYLACDLGLYIVVKILRGDFWYWIPLGGKTEIVNSIVCRLVVKLVTDFTSIVQFRHPNEVGGMYWMLSFVLTMGSLPVAITVAETELNERTRGIAWAVVLYFLPCAMLSFAVFFSNIERKYWYTFWSTQRGMDLTMSSFLHGESDAMKFGVFKRSRHHWVSIEEKVKKWVSENWARWEEEKPEWFTDQKKALVPVDFIPTTGEARRRESVRRASVDAEAEGGLGGALRASIRRASVGSVVSRVVPIKEDN